MLKHERFCWTRLITNKQYKLWSVEPGVSVRRWKGNIHWVNYRNTFNFINSLWNGKLVTSCISAKSEEEEIQHHLCGTTWLGGGKGWMTLGEMIQPDETNGLWNGHSRDRPAAGTQDIQRTANWNDFMRLVNPETQRFWSQQQCQETWVDQGSNFDRYDFSFSSFFFLFLWNSYFCVFLSLLLLLLCLSLRLSSLSSVSSFTSSILTSDCRFRFWDTVMSILPFLISWLREMFSFWSYWSLWSLCSPELWWFLFSRLSESCWLLPLWCSECVSAAGWLFCTFCKKQEGEKSKLQVWT